MGAPWLGTLNILQQAWELGTSLRIEEISFNLFLGWLKQVIYPICVTEHQGPWFLDIAPKMNI